VSFGLGPFRSLRYFTVAIALSSANKSMVVIVVSFNTHYIFFSLSVGLPGRTEEDMWEGCSISTRLLCNEMGQRRIFEDVVLLHTSRCRWFEAVIRDGRCCP
jgi:hypothetical protein